MSAAVEARRIGPNAIIRVGQAVAQQFGDAVGNRVFAQADLARYLEAPPEHMVDEREVTRLHQELRIELGDAPARLVARDAGVRTGDYLLAHRIPASAQKVLYWLPAPLASRALLAAIRRNAWTFAGSGELWADAGFPPSITITGCCICRGAKAEVPLCDYYAAAFERLFQVLVHGAARVRETACQAMGADACRFEIVW
jgi:divinyl protochlorophyllide a 8-vinyl-reductase